MYGVALPTLSWTEIGQKRIPVAFDQSSRLRPVYAVSHAHTSSQGYPLQNPAPPTPTVPPPPTFSNGSPCEHLYCVSLKRFKNFAISAWGLTGWWRSLGARYRQSRSFYTFLIRLPASSGLSAYSSAVNSKSHSVDQVRYLFYSARALQFGLVRQSLISTCSNIFVRE